jgi:hypothetical protein
MKRCIIVAVLFVSLSAAAWSADGLPFKVRAERPRIWIRAKEWAGPSIPKLRKWFKLPEYQKRGVARQNLLCYVADGDAAKGGKAVEWVTKYRVGGHSPSYTGGQAQRLAAAYDWVRTHPSFTDEKRKPVVAYLEKLGDYYLKYVTGTGAPIYYSRYPGAIGGLCVIGLALHGDSPKAEKYIAGGYKAFVEYGKAREYEDGSSAGGTYSIHHAFPALARAAIAFESATDAGLLKFIKEKQGNWLERQLLWQIWSTKPNGYFVKEGDLWQETDARQTKFQIDQLAHILNNGYGRAHADLMFKRWGTRDYHRSYMWEFFVFNNPEIKPLPLDGLGKAELFGRDSHGYVIFRDGWDKGLGNTHIFFRCGEGLDVHSNRGAGGFDIFRHRTLAERANKDYPKDGRDDHIKYSNVVVFNGHDHRKTEMKTDVKIDFPAFLARKKRKGYELASILDFEVKKEYARVKGDISAAVKRDCKLWTRELVYLGYKYLIVLDRIETKGEPVERKWQLHFNSEPKVDGKLASSVTGAGKLFCQTLLPKDAVVSGEKAGKYFRHAVTAPNNNEQKTTFLHVLFPTDANVATMPKATVKQDGAKLTVTVGDLSYTFEN